MSLSMELYLSSGSTKLGDMAEALEDENAELKALWRKQLDDVTARREMQIMIIARVEEILRADAQQEGRWLRS